MTSAKHVSFRSSFLNYAVICNQISHCPNVSHRRRSAVFFKQVQSSRTAATWPRRPVRWTKTLPMAIWYWFVIGKLVRRVPPLSACLLKCSRAAGAQVRSARCGVNSGPQGARRLLREESGVSGLRVCGFTQFTQTTELRDFRPLPTSLSLSQAQLGWPRQLNRAAWVCLVLALPRWDVWPYWPFIAFSFERSQPNFSPRSNGSDEEVDDWLPRFR